MDVRRTAIPWTTAPWHWRSAGVLFLASTLVTLTGTAGVLKGWPSPRWTEFTAAPRTSTFVLGLLAAGVGAILGGTRHTVNLGRNPPVGWPAVLRSHLILPVAAITLGQAVGLAPVGWALRSQATAGGPVWPAMLSATAGIWMLLCLGYLVGAAWSNRVAPFAAMAVTLAALIVPFYLNSATAGDLATGEKGFSWYSVALVWTDFQTPVGSEERATLAAQRLVMFLTLGVSLLSLSVFWNERGQRSAQLRMAVVGLLPVLFGASLILRQPALVEPTNSQACGSVGTSDLCVPSEVSGLLNPTLDGTRQVVDRFGHGALTEELRRGTRYSDLITFSYFEADGRATRLSAVSQTLVQVVGLGACDPFDDVDDVEAAHLEAVAHSLAQRLGVANDLGMARFVDDRVPPTFVARIESYSDQELRVVLDRESLALSHCTLSEELRFGR